MGYTEKSMWTTQDFQLNERYDAWQAMLNNSHLRWVLGKNRAAGFWGQLEVGLLGDLKVVRCACDPCSGLRMSREIGLDNSAYYGLLLILAGHEDVSCRGYDSSLGPNSFLLWDTTVPTSFCLHSRVSKITVFVPQNRMRDALPHVDNLVGKAINWQCGLGAVTASLISALSSHTGQMDSRQGYAAAETTIELISSCLWAEQPLQTGPTGADLLGRIKDYIETHLEDPRLDPCGLAEHFGISVRYLHLLFQEESFSVSRWILERRLEHCRRELIRAGLRKNITEVSFRWGFNDSAHFSRAFKKRYGLSPREYRNQHTT